MKSFMRQTKGGLKGLITSFAIARDSLVIVISLANVAKISSQKRFGEI